MLRRDAIPSHGDRVEHMHITEPARVVIAAKQEQGAASGANRVALATGGGVGVAGGGEGIPSHGGRWAGTIGGPQPQAKSLLLGYNGA